MSQLEILRVECDIKSSFHNTEQSMKKVVELFEKLEKIQEHRTTSSITDFYQNAEQSLNGFVEKLSEILNHFVRTLDKSQDYRTLCSITNFIQKLAQSLIELENEILNEFGQFVTQSQKLAQSIKKLEKKMINHFARMCENNQFSLPSFAASPSAPTNQVTETTGFSVTQSQNRLHHLQHDSFVNTPPYNKMTTHPNKRIGATNTKTDSHKKHDFFEPVDPHDHKQSPHCQHTQATYQNYNPEKCTFFSQDKFPVFDLEDVSRSFEIFEQAAKDFGISSEFNLLYQAMVVIGYGRLTQFIMQPTPKTYQGLKNHLIDRYNPWVTTENLLVTRLSPQTTTRSIKIDPPVNTRKNKIFQPTHKLQAKIAKAKEIATISSLSPSTKVKDNVSHKKNLYKTRQSEISSSQLTQKPTTDPLHGQCAKKRHTNFSDSKITKISHLISEPVLQIPASITNDAPTAAAQFHANNNILSHRKNNNIVCFQNNQDDKGASHKTKNLVNQERKSCHNNHDNAASAENTSSPHSPKKQTTEVFSARSNPS